jgi:CheY-like chemotaxis protein
MTTKTFKILAADDTEMNISLLERFIRKQGHELVKAVNGQEAVELFEKERPDMVLMDVMMPVMDGYDATRKIREISGEQWIPIIFMSAKVAVEDQVAGLDAGGDDYLTKPVNLRILGAKIKAMQRIADMRQSLAQYRAAAEEEKYLATMLMGRMTRANDFSDELLETWLLPAEHMSGDLVAACRTVDDRLYLMVADATGHGLLAAMLQLPISQIFYDMACSGYSVASIVTAMNHRLRELVPRDRFVAATIVAVDVRNQVLEIWNGGNPEAMFVDGASGQILRRFEPNAAPLGILSETDFEPFTVVYPWQAAGELILYSDGVIDADDPEGEPFGEERLEQAITGKGGQNAFATICAALKDHLAGRPGLDDVSVVSVRCPLNTDNEE